MEGSGSEGRGPALWLRASGQQPVTSVGAVWEGVSAWADRACGRLSALHWPREHEDQPARPSGRQELRHPVWSAAAFTCQPTAARGGGGCGHSRPPARVPSSARGMGTGLRSLCPAWSGPHVPVPTSAGQVCRPGVWGDRGLKLRGSRELSCLCGPALHLGSRRGGVGGCWPGALPPASPAPILPWYRPVSTGSDLGWPFWSF